MLDGCVLGVNKAHGEFCVTQLPNACVCLMQVGRVMLAWMTWNCGRPGVLRVYEWARLYAGTVARGRTGRENSQTMRVIGGLIGLVVTLGIGMFVYYTYLKQASPAGGVVATQAISTTRVEMDLSSIAQAERSYYAQNSTYGTMDQLVSGGELPIVLSGRDGYTYTMDAGASGFTVTAKWSPQTAEQQTLHAPTIVVDQTNQVHQVQ
jgi:hypothetical protein